MSARKRVARKRPRYVNPPQCITCHDTEWFEDDSCPECTVHVTRAELSDLASAYCRAIGVA